MITLVLADRRSPALGRLVIPGASAPGYGFFSAIAQLLSADGAAEINYKGMKPDDIDRLVCEAVANRDGSTLP